MANTSPVISSDMPVALELGAELGREGQEGEHVVLDLVHQPGELVEARPQLDLDG